jgi:hypothetical protein
MDPDLTKRRLWSNASSEKSPGLKGRDAAAEAAAEMAKTTPQAEGADHLRHQTACQAIDCNEDHCGASEVAFFNVIAACLPSVRRSTYREIPRAAASSSSAYRQPAGRSAAWLRQSSRVAASRTCAASTGGISVESTANAYCAVESSYPLCIAVA